MKETGSNSVVGSVFNLILKNRMTESWVHKKSQNGIKLQKLKCAFNSFCKCDWATFLVPV